MTNQPTKQALNIPESQHPLILAVGSDSSDQGQAQTVLENLVAIAEVKCREGDTFYTGKQGTGVMLTQDGYVLTAYHCIENFLPDWERLAKERPQNSKELAEWREHTKSNYCLFKKTEMGVDEFPIDFSNYALDEKHDLALIKIITGKEPMPTGVVLSSVEPNHNEPVSIYGLTKPGITVYTSTGLVRFYWHDNFKITHLGEQERNKEFIVHDAFLTDARAVPMVSGGALLNSRGQFIGVVSFTSDMKVINNYTKEIEYSGPVTGIVRNEHAVKLISQHMEKIMERNK
jgi:S1-C subfamily serine protease